jgi:caffeoyl-CoA O-methyltransferase
MSDARSGSWLDPAIAAYCAEHSTSARDALLDELAAETAKATGRYANMSVGGSQGALLQLLVRLTGARRAVEVGTFTGYSSICIARALPDDGHLTCCDISEQWTAIARRYWEKAGLTGKIELKLGPALDSLRELPTEPPVDVAFIDADKTGYRAYFEELLPRLRPGGLIMVDNTLWSGRVLDDRADDADTVALKAFNDAVAADDRVDVVLLPVADGLTLLRRR